jgi:hypothetical protein
MYFNLAASFTEHEVRIIYDFLTDAAGIATDADVEALNLLTNVFAELGDRKASSEKPLYQTTVERQAEARRQHLRGGSRTR